jgi:hypothetical protein
MKKICLTQGQFALVSNRDYAQLRQFDWQAVKRVSGFSATRSVKTKMVNGKRKSKTLYMHREILCVRNGLEVDHRNGNPLDNQRRNLRIVKHAKNCRGFLTNRPNKTSKYRGVSWHKQQRKWRARVYFEGKDYYAGLFNCERKAALAYDSKAAKLGFFREALNFPLLRRRQ